MVPDSAVGPGKIALLEQIERTGSLSTAADSLNMSYARAWHLVDSVNNGFVEPVALTATGGLTTAGALASALRIAAGATLES